ncbi:aminotransferase class I/II-fold pyridoxal phosphate-dependent enzyme [Chitinivibrio alkaliphilus]|uniref:8-amino-7-oxononanoate synthase n=1 Tax=Chitinivibrio alkaliphilus ACht1 TaxID=1313304 RepID=U7DBM2_9BACT|nr:8-amino-7-oxononanoate synthase [Chitinivibrio alkaliphilus]ERP38978.1 8-amino-7-oxononanoate synthase [Chitinivibrio alkaliphilus ACht1]
MTIPFYERLETRLARRRETDSLRKIPPRPRSSLLNFSTNSYLSLEECDEIHSSCKRSPESLSGNRASRLVYENTPLFEEIESLLTRFLNLPAALLFNSGYAANTGILQALGGRDVEIYSDRLNHASIVDGIILSGSRHIRYRHRDYHHLEQRLQRGRSPYKIIVSDSLFSMDGDMADTAAMAELAQKYGALTMVDEAHATGIYGKHRRGIMEQQGTESDIDIHMGTFSKALAGCGGFFGGSSLIRSYLLNTARSLIYSTALPCSVLRWNMEALRFVMTNARQTKKLLDRTAYFHREISALAYGNSTEQTHIIPLMTQNAAAALALSQHLRRQGILAPAIRPPTVPENSSRVRISLKSNCSYTDMDYLVESLRRFSP